MSVAHRTLIAGFSIIFAVSLIGCASSDASSCSEDEDCSADDFCTIEGFCEEDTRGDDGNGDHGDGDNNNDGDNGDGDNGDGDNGDGDNGDGDNGDGDNDVDPDAPTVVNISPGDGSIDVSRDTEIRVSFSEPLDAAFCCSNWIVLRTPTGTEVPVTAEYFDDEREIVLTPNESLREAARYTIDVTSSVRGATGIPLPFEEQVTSPFITEWTISDEIQDLADEFAPVLYQGTKLTDPADIHVDIPTRVDFAGGTAVAGNLSSAQQASADVPAHVYYSYSATESHHFLHYILYYAGRRTDDSTFFEHDFTGIVVVVDRETEAVEHIDGVHVGESSSDSNRYGYRPSSSTTSTIGQEESHDFDSSYLEDGTRFPLYVPSGNHVTCLWHEREDLGWTVQPCVGNDEEFRYGEGIIMRSGTAQTQDQATAGDDGHDEMTYGLLPFIDPMWTMRGDFETGLFTSPGFTYDPGTDRPHGPGPTAAYLPSSLHTNSTLSYGNLPYRWISTSASSNGGSWFLDPAWHLTIWYDFGDDYSDQYCYNLYFDIDRRSEPECQ